MRLKSKLTSKKRTELVSKLNQYANMDFTESNIKIFIENLVAEYPKMIEEAILDMFEKFTYYAFRDGRNVIMNIVKISICLVVGSS